VAVFDPFVLYAQLVPCVVSIHATRILLMLIMVSRPPRELF